MSYIYKNYSKPKPLLTRNPYIFHSKSANSTSSTFKIYQKLTQIILFSVKNLIYVRSVTGFPTIASLPGSTSLSVVYSPQCGFNYLSKM